ncbi:hypothetical protein NAL32_21585, partial [Chryseobacterium sp. Ch-15]
EKLGLIDLVNKSFDELTFLSFKIYEASKTINLKSNIIEKWNGLEKDQRNKLKLFVDGDGNVIHTITDNNLKDKSYDDLVSFECKIDEKLGEK